MELGRLWCHIKSSPLSAPFLDFLVGSILRLWGVFYRKLSWQALWNYTLLNCRLLLPPSRVLHTCHLSSFKDEARGVWVPGQPGSCMKTLHQNTSHNNSNKTSGFSWNVCKSSLSLLKKKAGKIHRRINLYRCMKSQPSVPELLKVNIFWIFKGFKKFRCELLAII